MVNLLVNKKLNVFFILLFCVCSSSAATEISPFFGLGNDVFSFRIEQLGNSTAALEFEPNIPGLNRIGISAYGLGLAISTRADVRTLDPNKGSSRFFDVQLGFNNLKWGIDLFVQDYTGFFLKNSNSPTFYDLHPNLKWTHYGLIGRYAMDNQGFLISALTTQSEQIKKSAGSYFITGGFRYHSLDSDQSLIPVSAQNINSEMDELRKLKASSLNLGLGAGKYWVHDSHFFAGGVFDLLGTFGLYSYEKTTGNSSNSYGTLSYHIKAAVGYSGQFFRSGLSLAQDVTTLQGFNSSFIKPVATQLLLYIRVAF